MIDERAIREKYEAVRSQLDERGRRLFAAVEVRAAGRGGVAAVARATGLGRAAIERGLKDLDQPALPAGRIRRRGGGRQSVTAKDPTLLEDLQRLVEPGALSKPLRPLLWFCKSCVTLADTLQTMGHTVSPNTVRKLIHELGYGRQANRKTYNGRQYSDRNAQFEHINDQALIFQAEDQPVLSVDIKKKILTREYRSKFFEKGTEKRVKNSCVSDSDFRGCEQHMLRHIYDFYERDGWLSVSITNSTVEFVVSAIRSWFDKIGQEFYPAASRLMITVDCGGLNKAGTLLWKCWLQELADETGMTISVFHLPPATTKWSKVEHRLFCHHMSQNCRGQPLISRFAVIELAGAATKAHGLPSENELDITSCRKSAKLNLDEIAALNIQYDAFHPNWNYTITPRPAAGR
jgi:hypothetical protein